MSNALLSTIATGLAGATLAKLTRAENLGEILEAKGVKMGEVEHGKRYHDWWVVPKVEIVDKST